MLFMMTRECMGRVWWEVCRWRFHEAEEVGPCPQPAFHHVKSLASTTCHDHEHQCSSMFIMILCVYLMFCRRLECYNTGGCVLVESRPINKVCFRRMWREWLGLSFKPISQEDVEADYEKLERRSRIRTARARQINPQVIRKMDENNWRRSTFLAKKM